MEKSKENSMNEVFLQKLTEAVFANLSNEQFGAEQLAEEVGLSRSQIHRRLQKINKKSVTQFIRELRLNEALRLLQKEVGTASEISYQVGFGSPTYFNKCFHEYFGYPPGEVKRKIEESTGMKTSFETDYEFLTKKIDKLPPPSESYQVFYVPRAPKKNKISYFISAGLVLFVSTMLIWYLLPKHAGIEIEKSIAVLPFINDSPDPENEYFCNGMMGTILNHLVKVGDLKVMSRADVEPYRGSSKSRKEIAKELGVANILEASVYKMGNKFRLSIQLINPESGFHLWSDSYEGEYTEEIFALQSDIAKDVALALKAVITPEEEQKIEKPPTTDIEAYDYLNKGWEMFLEYWQSLDNKYWEIARNLSTRALNIDPEYIDALALKSTIFDLERNADSVLFYADQIIKIDPNQYAGYYFRAIAYWQMDQSELALASFKKALQVEPDNVWVNASVSKLYCKNFQDFRNGLIHINKAVQLEDAPSSSLTIIAAEVFLLIGLYEKAEEYIFKAIDIGERCQGIQRLCECLFAQGRLNESINYLDSICDISACEKLCSYYKFYVNMALHNFESAEKNYIQISKSGNINDNLWSYFDIDSILLAYMYKNLGDANKSSAIFNNIRKYSEEKLTRTEDLPSYEYLRTYFDLSSISAIQGDKEAAFGYLKKAVDKGLLTCWSDFTQMNLFFENLKDESEYKAFIKKAEKERKTVMALFREMKERGELDL